MKIINIKTFHVKPRWMFVKVETDEGVTGWGEAMLEGRATVVENAVHTLGTCIKGKNPMNIEALWQIMYKGGFYRGGAILCSAVSGIEQALWDIKGKALGVPIWQLLGGACRNKILMYAHITPTVNPTTEELCEKAQLRVRQGFKALKTVLDYPFLHIDTPKKTDEYVEKFGELRKAVGKDIHIAIDFHGRVSPAMAKRLCQKLEKYDPMFVEEPVLPENTDELLRVAESTSIPIATGERLFTTWGYRELLKRGGVQVLQPDLCQCGGILQAFKIAAMAENNYCSIAPHNPLGPLSLASCLQLDACIPNFTAQEHLTLPEKTELGVQLLKQPFKIEDGYIPVPQGAGLGVEVDEEQVRKMEYDGRWMNPVEFHEDGSFAEW